MKPRYSAAIHVISEEYIKVDLGVRLSQDTWDSLFKLPKTYAGTSLAHPEKGTKQTFFGFEVRFNSCWSYKTILVFIFDTLKLVKEIESIRINNLVEKNDDVIDCKPFS